MGLDIVRMVHDFFSGNSLPKSITHTNLFLISLSNFINKILSKIIHDRIKGLLPKIIFPNQFGFVKGRIIIETILLTQELIKDIRK